MFKPLATVALLSLVLAGCGGGGADSMLKEGRTVYGNVCSACHGDAGQGGVGPALADVTATFPSCTDHIEWISLGSEAWKAVYGDTRGTKTDPIEGLMPGHSESLTTSEIALVAAFERSNYGGLDEQTAIDQCNIVP
jgi:mono/diheme cytochrome c family protein